MSPFVLLLTVILTHVDAALMRSAEEEGEVCGLSSKPKTLLPILAGVLSLKASAFQVPHKGMNVRTPTPATQAAQTLNKAVNILSEDASALASAPSKARATVPQMALPIDMKGKVAFIAGVGDSSGYGWAIAKAMAGAGAKIIVGTWPPVLGIFEKSLKAGKFDEDMILPDGSKMVIEKVYPLDAVFDTPADVTDEIKNNKRYAGLESFTIEECAAAVAKDYGKIDILIHSLANGPEVTKPLLETSRNGYLAAQSASAYSMVSLVQKFGPIMPEGGSVLSLTYIASEFVIPGYGGGMSSAKASLESDTRVLAYEAGQKYGIRVNTISAGPLKSRAASAIGKGGDKTFIEVAIDYCRENAPLNKDLYADDVGRVGAFLSSPWADAVTGVTMYVDNGMHAMGMVTKVATDDIWKS
jgi:enoyl-[acyl-carrier protein] reductase I